MFIHIISSLVKNSLDKIFISRNMHLLKKKVLKVLNLSTEFIRLLIAFKIRISS